MLNPYARDSLVITLDLDGANWTGWTFKGEIRAHEAHDAPLIETLNVNQTGAPTGIVVYSLSAAEMQAIAPDVTYWFDLRATLGTQAVTFYKDQIKLNPNVTA